jgi:hypothetical protein
VRSLARLTLSFTVTASTFKLSLRNTHAIHRLDVVAAPAALEQVLQVVKIGERIPRPPNSNGLLTRSRHPLGGLHAGTGSNPIRGWLGHVSVDTTNVYAEVDVEIHRLDGTLAEGGPGALPHGRHG